MLKFILFLILYLFFILVCSFFSLKTSDGNFLKGENTLPYYSILTVKNQEDSIEGIVRNIVKQMQYGRTIFTELVILDLNSDDSTPTILFHLSKEYPFIHITDKKNYKAYIENLG